MRVSESAGHLMRCLSVAAVLFGCLMPVGFAQSEAGRDAGLTLATVKLSAAIRSKIELVVFGNLAASQRRAEAALTQIDRLKLGPGSLWVWEVISPPDRCGINECEYWLFDSASGASLVDDAVGTGLDVLDTRHHGWRDFVVSGFINHCEDVTVYYHFDGRRYQFARRDEDTSACDQ